MRPALASMLLLAGCGGAPFHAGGGCSGGVFTEDLRDCYCVNDEHAAAELVLTRLGLEPPQHVVIWLRASDESFEIAERQWAWGQTLDADDVVLSRWGGGWAHELMHVLELRAGVPKRQTAAHVDWKARGWLDAGQAFHNGEPHCD